jgi:O-antigen ligase
MRRVQEPWRFGKGHAILFADAILFKGSGRAAGAGVDDHVGSRCGAPGLWPQIRQVARRDLKNRSILFDLRPGLRLLGALFSFEALFIFFLISVNYKADPRFSWFPIDLTVIFFVLGVTTGLAIIYREGIYPFGLTVVSLLTVFIVWALVTDLWTPSELYAQEKLFKLATLNLWSVIATAMIIANRRERVRRFLLLLLVLGTAASLDGIVQYATTDRFALSSGFRLENYIAQSRFYSMGALVAFTAWLDTSPFSKRGVALMAAFAASCFALLIASARAPMLAMVAAVVLPLALGLRVTERRLLASRALVAGFVLSIAMAAVLLQVAADYSDSLPTFQRFTAWFGDDSMGRSASQRLEAWTGSWDLWLRQPFLGSGAGSWPIRYYGLDVARYPHNLILEVLVEFGVVGLLLLAVVAIVAARHTSVRHLREDPFLMCAAMLCISTFLHAMTSEDITGNRNLFAMFGLLAMRPYRRTAPVGSERRASKPASPEQEHSGLRQRMPKPGPSG